MNISPAGGGGCKLPEASSVREVSVHTTADKFRGLVLTFKDSLSESLMPPLFEVFLTPIGHHTRFTYDGEVARRLISLQVRT